MATHIGSAVANAQPRLGAVRRFYFYLVALVAFVAGLFAFDALIGRLAETWMQGTALFVISGPGFVRNTVAATASILAVATPIFLIHWHYIQRHLDDPEERSAALRKFYFAAASAFSLGFALVRADHLLSGIAAIAFGQPTTQSEILPSAWLYDLVVAAAAAALLAYWQAVARADGDYGTESGLAGTWRRLFLAGVTLTGLILIALGSANVVSALLQRVLALVHPAVSGSWFPREMGDGVALLLLGAVTARTAWRAWQSICVRVPTEQSTIVRLLFLYVAVVGGAVATLVPTALIVRDLLLSAFSSAQPSGFDLLERAANILGFIPVGIWVWTRHWRLVQAAEARTTSAAGMALRRIYYYAMSATGLVLLWLGLVYVTQVVLDMLLTSDQLKLSILWQRPLANGLSLLVVGAPVWALHWQAVQRVARQPDEEGADERGSLPRRIYLYGVSFAGAILVLFYFAQVLYRLFLFALGDRTTALFSSELAEELARSLIAAILWTVHFVALRRDAAMGVQRTPAADRRARLEHKIALLEEEIARLRAELEE